MSHPFGSRRPLLAIPFLLVLFLLTLVSACSDEDDPVTPPPPAPDREITGTLGAAGGTLKSDDGSLEFTVPAGALSADTEISIKEVDEADVPTAGQGLDILAAFNMTPVGLQLAVPATLTFGVDLPVPSKENVQRVGVPVTLVTDEFLALPQNRTIQELMRLTVDLNETPARAVVTLRGLPSEAATGVPRGTLNPPVDSYVATFHEWQDNPLVGDVFPTQVGLETSGGLNLVSSVQYKVTDLFGISTQLTDGEVLTPQSEGETTDGGYRRNYLAEYLAETEGNATLNFGVEYQVEHDYEAIYGDEFDAPVIEGNTFIEHYLKTVNLTVLPQDDNSEYLVEGLYPGETAGEGIKRIRGYIGWKYNDTVLTSGGDGTSIRSVSKTNPMAVRFNGFSSPGLTTYGGFLISYSFNKADLTGLTFVQYGPTGILFVQWDPDIDDFGWGQLGMMGRNVTDGQPYGGDVGSGGIVLVDNTLGSVPLFEYNPDASFYESAGILSSFPEAPGKPVTAAVRPGGVALVVCDGSPGRIYTHDRIDPFADAVSIGDAGDSPRRVRTSGGLAVVSNFGSDNLTVLTWTASDVVTIVGTVPVGDGPVGIDLMNLDGGNVAVASTGFNDNTYTVTVLTPAGAVVTNTTMSLPAGAEGPGHVAWLRDPGNLLMVSCNTTGNVAVVDPGMK